MRFRRCDNCGTINPPTFKDNPRLCANAACLKNDGFYKPVGSEVGTNGKVGLWRLQIPFYFRWRGWWTL